jgi:thiol-disulfide isomerase/thioredoxin
LVRGALLALALVAAGPVGVGPAAATTQQQVQEQRAKLVQYSADTDLKALAAEGKTVVFFFATWCPNCILTLTELSEKWSEIEPDITLVIADYDTETALKAEYGVTYQDTFVLLDSSARAAKLWNAGGVAGLNANTRTE